MFSIKQLSDRGYIWVVHEVIFPLLSIEESAFQSTQNRNLLLRISLCRN
jgi:hypothetical protein